MCYPKSVNFIEFLIDFCIYDDIVDTIQIIEEKLLHFKLLKLGQMLRVVKTYFPRPGHILLPILLTLILTAYRKCHMSKVLLAYWQWRSQPNSDARAQIFYSQRNYMSRR